VRLPQTLWDSVSEKGRRERAWKMGSERCAEKTILAMEIKVARDMHR
jgi:hypothetical protein